MCLLGDGGTMNSLPQRLATNKKVPSFQHMLTTSLRCRTFCLRDPSVMRLVHALHVGHGPRLAVFVMCQTEQAGYLEYPYKREMLFQCADVSPRLRPFARLQWRAYVNMGSQPYGVNFHFRCTSIPFDALKTFPFAPALLSKTPRQTKTRFWYPQAIS